MDALTTTPRRQTRSRRRGGAALMTLLMLSSVPTTTAANHMQLFSVPLRSHATADSDDATITLRVVNNCTDDIYPGILTQGGTAPETNGFLLNPGASKTQYVSPDWQGRVWGRTNCSFNDNGTAPAVYGQYNGTGKACLTGDCGGTVACAGTGETPATLAEFTLQGDANQTYYDISLVDGYNLPIGIRHLGTDNSSTEDIPPNLTNPICIGSPGFLTAQGTYTDETWGSNATYPIPLDQAVTRHDVQHWCPFALQVVPPPVPGDGVYPYPDENIARPDFDPCWSACAKLGDAKYCCTGKHDTPETCSPSEFSTAAKKVCPDAYSFAYDDGTSTFIIPSGGGWEITFCPVGRSTTILSTLGDQLTLLSTTGTYDDAVLQNTTYIRSNQSKASSLIIGMSTGWWAVVFCASMAYISLF